MEIVAKTSGNLLEYLQKNTDITHKNLKKYLKNGSIYVDDVRTTKFNYPIYINSIIRIDTKSSNKKILPFDVIYEDDNIIVVDKPSGLLSIATSKEKEETCYHIVREYLRLKNKNAKIFIVHRLDKDTSGVLILAKNEHTKNLFQQNWDKFVKKRSYIAIVHGKLTKKEDKLVFYLKETKTNLVYVTNDNDGKKSITNYKVIAQNNNYSKLQIEIETGRKNQIRVSLAKINHPILGDKKYGKDSEKRLFLHADLLEIKHPITKKQMIFKSKIPKEFELKIK